MKCKKCSSECIVGAPWGKFYCAVCNSTNIDFNHVPKLSVSDKHQLNIARKTLKMPDAILGVMGGMTKQEAKKIVKKLTVILLLAFLIGCSDVNPIQSDCREDMPCWDCATMGNQICGPNE